MTTNQSKVYELIEYLQGTCMSLSEGVQSIFGDDADESILDDEALTIIDSEIFLCETCGWWCEICEDEGDNICTDCAEDE